MALVSTNEVGLALSAKVEGTSSIRSLSEQLAAAAEHAGEASPQLKALAAEVAALDSQQGAVETLIALKRETAVLGREMEAAQGNIDALATSLDEARSNASAAAEGQTDAAARLASARSRYDELKAAVAGARTELDAARAKFRESGGATDEYAQQVLAAREKLASYRAELKTARASVGELASEHRAAGKAAREAASVEKTLAREYDQTIAGARRLSAELGAKNRVLQATGAFLKEAGVNTRALGDEQKRLAAAADDLSGRITNIQRAASRGAQGIDAMGREAQEAQGAMTALGGATDSLQTKLSGVAKAVAGVFAIGQVKGYIGDMIGVADAYGQMAERIGMATASSEEYDLVQRRLLDTANTVYRPLAEAQELYIRTADALRSMHYSTEQALDITDSFSYLLATNAANAEKAASAVSAYSKAVQSGKIDADAWQSILASMPTVVDAVAAATGKSAEEIRKLGVAGKLALADLNEGLRQTVDTNRQATEGMSTTVTDALTKLSNTWQVYIGEANRASGATEQIAGLIDMVSDNLEELVTVATRAGEVIVAVFAMKAVRAVQAFGAAQLAAVGTVQAVTAATNAQAAAATASARGLNLAAAATGLLAGAGKAAVAPIVAMTAWTTRQTQAVWANVTALRAQKAALLATGWGAAVVGIGALIAKFTESKEKAVELGEAVDQALDQPEDKVTPQLRLLATEAEAARFQLAEVQQQFQGINTDAARTASELKKVVGAADIGSVDGIAKLSADLALLKDSAHATGEQIDTALRDRLAQLTANELREFAIQAEMAFNQGHFGAEELARINDQVLAASFARLGINAAQALGKVSPAAQEAIDGVDGIVLALERTGASAAQTGAAVEIAISQALAKADSTAALDALIAKVEAMGRAGILSADQVATALDRIKGKSDELTPGINSVGEALKRLGIISDAELKKTAAGLREAYEAVVKLGGSTREQAEAFRHYAEAAIAANGGVADSALAAQAAQHGLSIKANESGKAIVSSMTEAARATSEVGDAGTEAAAGLSEAAAAAKSIATEAKAAATAAKDAAESLVDAARRHNDAVSGVSVPWLQGAAAASRYADEAGRAAQRAADAASATGLGMRSVAHSIQMGRLAAQEFVETMEALDRRQADLTQGASDGVEDLRLRLLELEGTEEEVARARAERDRAARERQIALLQIEIERAKVRGDTEEAARLQRDIGYLKEQIALLGKIEAAETRRRVAAQKRQATESGSSAISEAPRGGNTGSTSVGAITTAPASVHRVSITLGRRSVDIETATAGDASALVGLLKELENSARVT